MRRRAGARMMARRAKLRMLLVGAAPRMVGAAVVVAALWAGFFWASSTPGAL